MEIEFIDEYDLDDQDVYHDCWNCGGTGYSHHDCGDDCCCCADPEDNVVCDVCDGAGGWRDEDEGTPSESECEKGGCEDANTACDNCIHHAET